MKKEVINVGAISAVTAFTLIALGLTTLQPIYADDMNNKKNNQFSAVLSKSDQQKDPFNLAEFVRLRRNSSNLTNSNVLKFLGLTPEQFIELREGGVSLKAYAEQNDISVDELSTVIKAEIISHIKELLDYQIISEAQYNSVINNKLDEMVEVRLNVSGPVVSTANSNSEKNVYFGRNIILNPL